MAPLPSLSDFPSLLHSMPAVIVQVDTNGPNVRNTISEGTDWIRHDTVEVLISPDIMVGCQTTRPYQATARANRCSTSGTAHDRFRVQAVIGPISRDMACAAVSIILVISGMLLTGLLPSGWRYQLLAGGIIVAGFGVGYFCFDEWE